MSDYGTYGGGELLAGQDSNPLNIVAFTTKALKRRQIDRRIIEQFVCKCLESEYDTLLSMSRVALDNTDPAVLDMPSENIGTLDDLITHTKS